MLSADSLASNLRDFCFLDDIKTGIARDALQNFALLSGKLPAPPLQSPAQLSYPFDLNDKTHALGSTHAHNTPAARSLLTPAPSPPQAKKTGRVDKSSEPARRFRDCSTATLIRQHPRVYLCSGYAHTTCHHHHTRACIHLLFVVPPSPNSTPPSRPLAYSLCQSARLLLTRLLTLRARRQRPP